MKNNTLIMIILIIVVGTGGFFGGIQYQKSRRSVFTRQFGGTQGQFGTGTGARNRNGTRPVSGDILSSDKTSITVKLTNGSTVIVLVTGSTTISKATPGSKTDLTSGARVAAFGTENSDGTMTATNIQINPVMRGPGDGNNPSPGAQTTP